MTLAEPLELAIAGVALPSQATQSILLTHVAEPAASTVGGFMMPVRWSRLASWRLCAVGTLCLGSALRSCMHEE